MGDLILTIGSLMLGLPRASDAGVLTLQMDDSGTDVPHAQILDWDGKSLGDIEMVPWHAVGVVGPDDGSGDFLVVGETGETFEQAGRARSGGTLPVERDRARARGPLRGARAIGGTTWVVGMDLQIFRRERNGAWTMDDGKLRQDGDLQGVPGLETVFGNDPAAPYAAGWQGTIVSRHRDCWRAESSPVNAILTDGVELDDGTVVVVGRAGTIVTGRRGRWSPIEHPWPFIDFWGVAAMAGRIFLSSFNGLFELSLSDGALSPLDVQTDPQPTTYSRLFSGAGVLWSVGTKDLLEFDGHRWSKLI